jgi:hypothetical protein
VIASIRATASSAIVFPVARNRSAMYGANSSGGITPSSMCLALRQNGSFLSLKIRRIM